jgi:hypothetical protein
LFQKFRAKVIKVQVPIRGAKSFSVWDLSRMAGHPCPGEIIQAFLTLQPWEKELGFIGALSPQIFQRESAMSKKNS